MQLAHINRFQASSAVCPSVSHSNLLSQTAFLKAARLSIVLLSCLACIRLVCVGAEEEEQEKAQAAVKAEKAKKEKQRSKKAKQKVTVNGIWQEVYTIRSLSWLSEATKGKYANSATQQQQNVEGSTGM